MGEIKTLSDSAFRNFVIPDVPASGDNEPDKAAIRGVFAKVDSEVSVLALAQQTGRIAFETLAELEAITDRDDGTVGEVWGEADQGTYSFADGDWTRIGDLGIVAQAATLNDLSEASIEWVLQAADATASGWVNNSGVQADASFRHNTYEVTAEEATGQLLAEGVVNGAAQPLAIYLNASNVYLGFEHVGSGSGDHDFTGPAAKRLSPPSATRKIKINSRVGAPCSLSFGATLESGRRVPAVEADVAALRSSISAWEPVPATASGLGFLANFGEGAVLALDSERWAKFPYEGLPIQVTARILDGGASALNLINFYGEDDALIGTAVPGTTTATTYTDYEPTFPAGTVSFGVNSRADFPIVVESFGPGAGVSVGRIEAFEAVWQPPSGQTILVAGTSIEGADTPANSYLVPASDRLRTPIVNSAIGASMARIGIKPLINGGDPKGWSGRSWQNVLYCLAMTVAEKQDMIDNWATYRLILGGSPPTTLTDDHKYVATYSSYENRILPFVTAGVAVVAMAHGRNDRHFSGGVLDTADLVDGLNGTDRTTMFGAINHIFAACQAINPRQQFAILSDIGHDGQYAPVVAAQKTLAASWGAPFIPLGERLGYSEGRSVTVGGVTKTRYNLACPDGLHPHSDLTGRTNEEIAAVFAREMRQSVLFL